MSRIGNSQYTFLPNKVREMFSPHSHMVFLESHICIFPLHTINWPCGKGNHGCYQFSSWFCKQNCICNRAYLALLVLHLQAQTLQSCKEKVSFQFIYRVGRVGEAVKQPNCGFQNPSNANKLTYHTSIIIDPYWLTFSHHFYRKIRLF